MNMQIGNQQILDAVQALAGRPEWCERSMDPERAKVDFVLFVARGGAVTVAGMARRWGMPRTSARRVIQTAAVLVPWLDTYLDSPKKDPVIGHEATNLDTMADMGADSLPDSQNQGAAEAPAMLADIVADTDMDSPVDSPQNLQSGDHEAGGLVMTLDTMTEPEPTAAIHNESALFDDVQKSEPMDIMADRGADSQSPDGTEVPAMPMDTMADTGVDSPLYTFLDLSGPDDDHEDHAELDQVRPVIGIGLRRPPAAVSPAPTPAVDNEASVEAKAREMALEAWDLADARTFETCQGDFDQFWTYRKRHFLAQARQELAAS
ncbi:MAG: hypothetical protein AB7D27_17895 [Desulfomicrobium sp.]